MLLFPLLGNLLDIVLMLLSYAFIRELPLEVWYISKAGSLLGGMPVYYMGYYSYGASITSLENRFNGRNTGTNLKVKPVSSMPKCFPLSNLCLLHIALTQS